MTLPQNNNYRSALLPEEAAAARLIVCERTGGWAVALRREFGAESVRIQETRNLTDCWSVLAEAPASFVIAELSAGSVEPLLRQMARLHADFPLARAAVVADRRLADHQWLMREAGAAHFVCSPRRCGPLARLAAAHLAQSPQPQRSLAQQIWAGLPWARNR